MVLAVFILVRFYVFCFEFSIVPFVATRSQLEQEQEREWVRWVVAMTC